MSSQLPSYNAETHAIISSVVGELLMQPKYRYVSQALVSDVARAAIDKYIYHTALANATKSHAAAEVADDERHATAALRQHERRADA